MLTERACALRVPCASRSASLELRVSRPSHRRRWPLVYLDSFLLDGASYRQMYCNQWRQGGNGRGRWKVRASEFKLSMKQVTSFPNSSMRHSLKSMNCARVSQGSWRDLVTKCLRYSRHPKPTLVRAVLDKRLMPRTNTLNTRAFACLAIESTRW